MRRQKLIVFLLVPVFTYPVFLGLERVGYSSAGSFWLSWLVLYATFGLGLSLLVSGITRGKAPELYIYAITSVGVFLGAILLGLAGATGFGRETNVAGYVLHILPDAIKYAAFTVVALVLVVAGDLVFRHLKLLRS